MNEATVKRNCPPRSRNVPGVLETPSRFPPARLSTPHRNGPPRRFWLPSWGVFLGRETGRNSSLGPRLGAAPAGPPYLRWSQDHTRVRGRPRPARALQRPRLLCPRGPSVCFNKAPRLHQRRLRSALHIAAPRPPQVPVTPGGVRTGPPAAPQARTQLAREQQGGGCVQRGLGGPRPGGAGASPLTRKLSAALAVGTFARSCEVSPRGRRLPPLLRAGGPRLQGRQVLLL